MNARKRIWLVHPFLITIAPILSVYISNYAEADGRALLALCGMSMVGCGVVFGAARWLLRDSYRAACWTSLLGVLFFTYGRVFQLVAAQKQLLLTYRTWHIIMLSTMAVVLGGAFLLLKRSRRDWLPMCRFLTVASGILLGFMLTSVVRYELAPSPDAAVAIANAETVLPATTSNVETAEKPDIYYIIPDAYCRQDVLKNLFAHDNSEFVNYLRSRGFYVADQSCSNYPYTFLSVPSSLNLRYLDAEIEPHDRSASRPWSSFLSDHRSLKAFQTLTSDPLAARILKSKGYRFVHFRTNYWVTQRSEAADLQIGYLPEIVQNEFVQVVMRTTALCMFEPSMADMHLHAFKKLTEMPKHPGPKFVFAHLVTPHAPYVFDREGNVRDNVQQAMVTNRTKQTDRDEYRDQLIYVNKRLREIIDTILAQSTTTPIIIIQADHGFDSLVGGNHEDPPADWDLYARERLPILNAYLVPEAMRKKLYPTISPVNTFRLLFSECFGESFELLPDRNYIGWYHAPFDLQDATEVVRTQGAPPHDAPQRIDELMAKRYHESLQRK